MKLVNKYLDPFRPREVRWPKIGDWFCDKHKHTMLIIPDDAACYCPRCYHGLIARKATLRRNKLIQELLKGSEGHSNGQGSKQIK